MTSNRIRFAAWALIIGGLLTIAGYVAVGAFVGTSGDGRFTHSLWTPLNSVAIAGDIITLFGLPTILMAHGDRAPRLTIVGYIGIFATIVMLNIAEGCIEAFIKPYLATHGGVPADAPGGLGVFEGVALLCLVVGLICLGIAIIRAGVFPRWVGALFIASPVAGFVAPGLPGPLALLSDYLAFAGFIAIGCLVVRTAPERRNLPTTRVTAEVAA